MNSLLLIILDYIAMIGTIVCLNLSSRTYKAWGWYLIPTTAFIIVVASARLPGQTIMGLSLFITGIRNFRRGKKRQIVPKKRKKVVISGGFDPIHIGHMRLIQEASKLGALTVILNTDKFLKTKKGFVFMSLKERMEILRGIKGVSFVIPSIDKDMTVRKTLKIVKPDIFANGGDRTTELSIPEAKVCKKIGCKMMFNIGGGKIQSSSWLTNNKKIELIY